MTSPRFKDTLVLVPGWATDRRVFEPLQLDYNYLFPIDLEPGSFNNSLLRLLDEASLEKASLLGWSQGGYLAADFAAKNPGRVEELILVSIREKYDAAQLGQIKTALEKNKKAFLYKFYLGCFSAADAGEFSWFKNRLLKSYTEEMDLETLLAGLDHLAGARIDTQALARVKQVRFFHGADDVIAPVSEALRVQAKCPGARWDCISNAGHLPFLKYAFKERFENG